MPDTLTCPNESSFQTETTGLQVCRRGSDEQDALCLITPVIAANEPRLFVRSLRGIQVGWKGFQDRHSSNTEEQYTLCPKAPLPART